MKFFQILFLVVCQMTLLPFATQIATYGLAAHHTHQSVNNVTVAYKTPS